MNLILIETATEKLESPHRLGDSKTCDVEVVLVIRDQSIKLGMLGLWPGISVG